MSNAANDPVKHVVLLMMENRSFDHMLGCFKDIYPDLAGIDKNNLKINNDLSGNPVQQAVTTNVQMDPDPKHELVNVLE
jgi:phospholipase C